jgi:chromosome segregation ATPase
VIYVKKAQKDNPAVKKGEEYWWVSMMTGPRSSTKRYFSRPPRPSETTTSEYYSTCYEIQERFDSTLIEDSDTAESVASDLQSASDDLGDLAGELEEKHGSLEEHFPGGSPTMETIQQRMEALETLLSEIDDAVSEIEAIDWDFDKEAEGTKEEQLEVRAEEAQEHLNSISWDFE